MHGAVFLASIDPAHPHRYVTSISASKEQESEILLNEINVLVFSSVETNVCLDVERNKCNRYILLLPR